MQQSAATSTRKGLEESTNLVILTTLAPEVAASGKGRYLAVTQNRRCKVIIS
jgi:hypothetical protein